MYKAKVLRINQLLPHPNADRLQIALLGNGVQVIVSGVNVGDLGVFFGTDGQLSEEFATKNDLIRRKDPVTGESAGGMFEQNRRVKSIKLRGVRSDGFWIPIKAFEYTGKVSVLQEGVEFDTLDKYHICHRYETAATQALAQKRGKTKTTKVAVFPQHLETDQLRFNVGSIPVGSELIISEKIHGTSHRVINGLVNTDPDWLTVLKTKWNSVFGRFLRLSPTYKHQIVHGTRRTVLVGREVGGFYGSDQFRYTATDYFTDRLRPNEIVYGEIVGFTDSGNPIMGQQDTTALKDKAITKKYGKTMTYAYGQKPGTSKFYCYRIAYVQPDGSLNELKWDDVEFRCLELGIEFVPVYKKVKYDGDAERLLELCESMVEGESCLDSSHIREGVVVRWQKDGFWGVLKHKSFTFGLLEGFLKDDDTKIDIEESS